MAKPEIMMKHSPHGEMTQGKCLLEPVLEGLLGEIYDRTEGYRRFQEKRPIGGMCAFFGTANSSRILTAGWGVVPKGLELLTDWANEVQIRYAVAELFENIRKGLSVSTIVKENCNNAIRVWSSTGGSTNLALHIP